nr:rhamnan synthesis F family protein [Nocardioides agariphilus]
MAHYDHRGGVGPHVRRQVETLASAVDRLLVVSTADLTDRSRAWLGERAELVERPNYGYDFTSYQVGLHRAGLFGRGDLSSYDEVVICNDTYVPVTPYLAIFDRMAAEPVDFWGLTVTDRVAPHVQSFFVAFRPWVVGSQTYRRFWSGLDPLSTRRQVILRHEVGLSLGLHGAGFRSGAYFRETDADKRLARRRVRWWAAHRPGVSRSREGLEKLRERSREPWNPAAALADRALDNGRLPFVKLDTLRYDPYGLGADKLLTYCEERLPDAFAGVRDFLDETAAYYPPRPHEKLRSTPPALVPLRRQVEYRRAP